MSRVQGLALVQIVIIRQTREVLMSRVYTFVTCLTIFMGCAGSSSISPAINAAQTGKAALAESEESTLLTPGQIDVRDHLVDRRTYGQRFVQDHLDSLLAFKSDPGFHEASGKYIAWQQSVEAHRNSYRLTSREKEATRFLWLLGVEYAYGNGQENDTTGRLRREIKILLSEAPVDEFSAAKSEKSTVVDSRTPGQRFVQDHLDRLLAFKDNPSFHEVGFAVAFRFGRWHHSLLDHHSDPRFTREEGEAVGHLIQLGFHYMHEKGAENHYSRWAREQIKILISEEKMTLLQQTDTGDYQPSSTAQKVHAKSPPISKEVIYTIIDTHILPGIKRALNVRLSRKVSKDVLHSIALELKNRDANRYKQTFIAYYLPGMEVGAGAWATTHFNPDLQVRIEGLTLEEAAVLVSEPESPSRHVIGKWLAKDTLLGSPVGKITIYESNGKILWEWKFNDGSTLVQELVERSSSKGRTFERKKGSSFGEYYVIDREGDLQLWDEYGHIMAAPRLPR